MFMEETYIAGMGGNGSQFLSDIPTLSFIKKDIDFNLDQIVGIYSKNVLRWENVSWIQLSNKKQNLESDIM